MSVMILSYNAVLSKNTQFLEVVSECDLAGLLNPGRKRRQAENLLPPAITTGAERLAGVFFYSELRRMYIRVLMHEGLHYMEYVCA